MFSFCHCCQCWHTVSTLGSQSGLRRVVKQGSRKDFRCVGVRRAEGGTVSQGGVGTLQVRQRDVLHFLTLPWPSQWPERQLPQAWALRAGPLLELREVAHACTPPLTTLLRATALPTPGTARPQPARAGTCGCRVPQPLSTSEPAANSAVPRTTHVSWADPAQSEL